MSDKHLWSDAQVEALRAWQSCGWVHPFTCPNRDDGKHTVVDGDLGTLIATRDGWVCASCDYTQDWAHPGMFNGPPPHPFPAFDLSRSEGGENG